MLTTFFDAEIANQSFIHGACIGRDEGKCKGNCMGKAKMGPNVHMTAEGEIGKVATGRIVPTTKKNEVPLMFA